MGEEISLPLNPTSSLVVDQKTEPARAGFDAEHGSSRRQVTYSLGLGIQLGEVESSSFKVPIKVEDGTK